MAQSTASSFSAAADMSRPATGETVRLPPQRASVQGNRTKYQTCRPPLRETIRKNGLGWAEDVRRSPQIHARRPESCCSSSCERFWWVRRKAIHEERFQSPLSTFSFITSYLEDIAESTRKVQRGRMQFHQDGPKWKAPPPGAVKIYVDAAVGRHEDGGAFAAVCRDGAGKFLGASAVSVQDITEPEVLEAMASNEGLSLALDLACSNVVIATDCSATVKHIKEAFLGPSTAIIHEIRRRIQMFASVHVVHENRSMNVEAHSLAKAATTLARGRHVWLLDRPDIICIPLSVRRLHEIHRR